VFDNPSPNLAKRMNTDTILELYQHHTDTVPHHINTIPTLTQVFDKPSPDLAIIIMTIVISIIITITMTPL
jgi:hypothetical protein